MRSCSAPPAPHPQKYTRVPQELQYSNSDILLAADDPGREQQQQLLQRVAADEADERDWRSRSAPPPAPADAQQQQQPGRRPEGGAPAASSAAAPAAAGSGSGEAPKIQKAADLGRTAWHAGVAAEGAEQTLRKARAPPLWPALGACFRASGRQRVGTVRGRALRPMLRCASPARRWAVPISSARAAGMPSSRCPLPAKTDLASRAAGGGGPGCLQTRWPRRPTGPPPRRSRAS